MSITLDHAEQRIEALLDRNSCIEHDLKHQRFLTGAEKFALKAELYENNKEITHLRTEIEEGRI